MGHSRYVVFIFVFYRAISVLCHKLFIIILLLRPCLLRPQAFSGYFTIPMGFCDLILKEGGREMPIKTWMEMLEKQIPAATQFFPPAIGHHADDTWEHVRITLSRCCVFCFCFALCCFASCCYVLCITSDTTRDFLLCGSSCHVLCMSLSRTTGR